ncbi:MAG: hypothetical protein CVU50_02395 [Candidatus Cloacimonetes bacterium HGW-Cloacimonetes-3]|jgi:hypothetical protein|nr:MAG: hypothetical protein CVU50_02395 [Candidatus Cloacimonetes bacterium HGW-Cloacimonetes-3]
MKTNLKLLCTLLFLIAAVLPVFAVFPDSKPQEQIQASELSSENREPTRVNQDIYEPDNTATDATSLGANEAPQIQHHTMHVESDVDWYVLGGNLGDKFHIYTTTVYPSVVRMCVNVYRRAYNGTYTSVNYEGIGYGERIDITITHEGNCGYLIELLSSYGGEAGSYEFWYQTIQPDSYEPDNSASQFTTISPSRDLQIENHTLHTYTDNDWYRFYGYAGVSYLFYSTGPVDIDLGVFGDDGTTDLTHDYDSGDDYNFRKVFTPTADAYYKLWVKSCWGLEHSFSTPIGYYGFCYSLNPISDDYEPDNSATQFTVIPVSTNNQTQNHTLHSNDDQDWYRFYGYADRIYQFYSTSTTDTQIYLYDDYGTLIDWDDNDGDGNNFYLRSSLPGDGFYKVKVVGNAGATGFYWFSYSEVPAQDIDEPDNSATQFTVIGVSSLNQTQDHTLHTNTDQDWFRIYGYTDRLYRFWSTSTIDTQIYLYDDYGTLLDWDDNDGTGSNFYLQFSVPENGYYKLKVVGSSGATGYYTLNWNYGLFPDNFEPDDSATQYTAISVSSTLQSQIHNFHNAGEQDWFRFYGTAGLTYNFFSTGNSDTRIYLYEDNGSSQLDWNDNDGEDWNYSLQFTPTTNNYYKLKVNGYPTQVGTYVFNYLYNADLSTPANVNLSIVGTSLTITWDEVAGAVSYQIEASADPYSGFAVIGTTGSTSWTGTITLDRGFYRIRATDTPVP